VSENVFYGVIFLDDEPVTLTLVKRLTAMLDEYVQDGVLDPNEMLGIWTKHDQGQLCVGFFAGNTSDLPSQGWTQRL
jgi:hypothetical protein